MQHRRTIQATLFLTSLLVSATSSCSGSGTSETSASEDTTSITASGTFGDRCTSDAECLTGLCLVNETAPFGWCSATCDLPWEPCDADTNGTIGGWCAQFPDTFATSPRQFCLPVCTDAFECKAKDPLWETCKVASYKGNILNGSVTGINVCQAPSQHGMAPVDSETCADWTAGYLDNFASQVNICKAYCDYLESCKETAENHTTDCCGYGCILQMTPEGVVNTIYERDLKCFITSFNANIGNSQVCSAPPKDCSLEPKDPTPK